MDANAWNKKHLRSTLPPRRDVKLQSGFSECQKYLMKVIQEFCHFSLFFFFCLVSVSNRVRMANGLKGGNVRGTGRGAVVGAL